MASIILVKIKLKILILSKLSRSSPKLRIAYEEKARPYGIGASVTALTSTLAAAQEPWATTLPLDKKLHKEEERPFRGFLAP